MTEQLLRRFVRDYEKVQDAQVRERYGMLSGGVGIFLNLLLSAGKFFAGVLTGSISITADAFNNLSDAGSSVVTLVGFRLAGQKADDDHPFGHGRIEYLAGLLVSMLILLVGVELGKSSIEKILHPEPVVFSAVSAGILLCSIAVKLWMCFFNRNLSRRIGSAAMAATAMDSLSDVVATSAVLLGAVVGALTGVSIDGWVGVLVALFILRAGWEAAKDTIDPLLGQTPDRDLVREIEQTILAHPEVVGIHDLIIHDYGPGRSMMSFHAEVPMNADIMEAHDVIDHIERELKEKFGIETSAHMDPIATEDEGVNRTRLWVAQQVKELDERLTIHDFRMTAGPHHTNLIFDVVAPHNFSMEDEALAAAIQQRIQAHDPHCYAVIQVDHAYVE
ncbi:cation transporter [Pseudoflavonifractor sp. DSM 107456]|uniref:Cation transporter n=2 Tax=Pseudoflavonifractor TaxID=1017280 RepID=A0ABR9R8E4_9FIRM|nr:MULTISPECIES: cation diffusion facilitator family transporter [Eubacteriales]MBC5729570.1 cation transporter [Pseudoflavonifractor hominis]MBE5054964.1 cation transporter [Pseudoflavonifractor gallinarum]MBT9685072.1 cation diffusion facilitator family transporter [Pseudoflavonifractor sp. MCC625]